MREVQQIVSDVRSDKINCYVYLFDFMTRFSNDSFALSLAYINWETDAIVGIELIRNIGIALGTNKTPFPLSYSIFSFASLHLRDDPDHAWQLARLAACDDVCPPHRG